LTGFLNELLADSRNVASVALTIVIVLAGGFLLIKSGDILVKKIFDKHNSSGKPLEARERTLISLLQSVIKYGTYFIMAITVLERLGVPVLALLSTAGVLGVGIAFGAQSLFKDVITGFFILLEDQYAVGDYIETQGVKGYVERITLRCTYLRDFGGQLHIVPNGTISLVTNHNRGSSRAIVDINVSYDDQLDKVFKVLDNVCKQAKKDLASVLIEGPWIWGVADLADSAVVIRLQARSKPLEQWGVEKYLRQKVKEAFDEEGLRMPYPHTNVILESSSAEK